MTGMAVLPPAPEPASPPLPPPPERGRPRFRGGLIVALVVVLIAAAAGGVVVATGPDAPRGTFRFLDRTASGGPVRWNPCEPIHYAVNSANAQPEALEDLRGAIARVSDATGLEFAYDGETRMTVGVQDHEGYFVTSQAGGHWLPVLVAWLPHDEFLSWATQGGAIAFGYPREGTGSLGGQYVSGLVVVDADADLPPGFDSRFSEGLVLMHELGHLVGLAHVSDPNEVMFTSQAGPGNPLDDWGPGDREGLHELGADGGCLRSADSAFSGG